VVDVLTSRDQIDVMWVWGRLLTERCRPRRKGLVDRLLAPSAPGSEVLLIWR